MLNEKEQKEKYIKKKRTIIIGIILIGIALGYFFLIYKPGLLQQNKLDKETLSSKLSYASLQSKSNEVYYEEYTPTTHKVCDNEGKCIVNLYGSTQFAFDNGWKTIDKASSLKNSPISCNVVSDGIHKATCLDWNLTSVTLKLSIDDEKLMNKNIPIRYLSENNLEISSQNITFDEKIKKNTTDTITNTTNEVGYIEEQFLTLPLEIGQSIHFGENSTIITINDTKGGVLEDTYIHSYYDLQNQGGSTTLQVEDDESDTADQFALLKFDISMIPNNISVESCDLYLYLDDNALDSGESYNVIPHHYPNQSWIESVTWATFDFAINSTNTSSLLFNSTTPTSAWYSWDINNSFNTEYNSGNNNLSIFMNASDVTGSPSSSDFVEFASKEYATVSSRPYLSLSYTYDDWLTGYDKRKIMSVNYLLLTADQSNFPVLINITDQNLSNFTQADGDDIVFTNIINEVLDYEIEYFNQTTGELVAWVEIPLVSSSNYTDFLMYFNNSGASNQQNPAGVWDSNTKMVQHLQEGYNNATTGFYKDSTVYGNNGTLNDPDGDSDFVKGLMDGAIYFDNAEQNGNGDEIRVASSTAFDSTTGTWEFWMKTTQQMVGEYAIIMTRTTQTSGSPSGIVVVLDPDEYILVQIKKVGAVEVASLNPAIAVDDGAWHHISVIFDGTNDAYLYIDGIQRASDTPSDSWAFNSQPMWFADSGDSFWETYIGTLDEIRVSNITRSASWINATYQNGINPIGFVILGDLETAPAVEDTCTYSSGNWVVDCSDNCDIDSDVDVGGNNISIIGTGTFTLHANITNYNEKFVKGTDGSNKCDIYCLGGCFN